MPDVFLSYATEDRVTAERVAHGLEASGLSVWWDRRLRGGADFSREIDRNLQASKAVIVLWSARSLDSDWVRDEATYARDEKKLIPVRIEDVRPPLGFRQVQCLELIGWSGDRSAAGFANLLASTRHFDGVAAHTGTPGRAAPAPIAEPPHARSSRRRTTVIVVLVAAIGLAALVIALTSERSAKNPAANAARFAILPFDALSDDPQARYFANGLADQIATTLTRNHIEVLSRDDALTLRAPERSALVERLGVAMLLDGTVQKDGDEIKVRTHIEDPVRHAIVYSSAFDGSAAHGDDLQAHIATAIVNVLACSSRALRPGNQLLDPALLAHYLHACDLVANQINRGPTETLELLANFRAVTVGAPNFVPALTDLAQWEAQFADGFPDQRDAMRKEAADAAQRALAIDPKAADAYAAQALLLPRSRFAEREKLLRAGIAADPNWPHPHGYLAEMLAQVGRTQEAVAADQVAASADLEIDWSNEATYFQARFGGPTAPCIDRFTTLMIVTPGYSGSHELFECRLFAGQLDEAVKIVRSDAALYAGTALGDAISDQVTAMKTASDADRRKAHSAWLALAADSPNLQWVAVQNLAWLGEADAAFALADAWQSPAVNDTQDTASLFSRYTESMRRDPRFMKLAARIGLVDYWQSTGHWPDFCADPKLAYDCRAEATRATQP